MSVIYTPIGSAYAAGITVASDGDPKPVASVNVGLKGLSENVEYLLLRVPEVVEVDGSSNSTIHGNDTTNFFQSMAVNDLYNALSDSVSGASLSIDVQTGDIIRVFCTTSVQLQPQPAATSGIGGYAQITHGVNGGLDVEMDGTLGAFWNFNATNNQPYYRYSAETVVTATGTETHAFKVRFKGLTSVLGSGAAMVVGPAFALRALVYRRS